MGGDEIRARLLADGFVVLPGLLSAETMTRLDGILASFFKTRGTVYNLGKTQPNAAMECPELDFVFSDPAVVNAFRSAIGEEEIVFTGHCDIHQDMFSDWHKDTGKGHGYFVDDCFDEQCKVVKMAVYLQDHSTSDGLRVQPGSHRQRDVVAADGTRVATSPGDVILFDVRLSHRGRAATRADRLLHLASRIQKKALSKVLRTQPQPGDVGYIYAIKRLLDRAQGVPTRRSLFFTFGAPNKFTDQFSRANMQRQRKQYAGSESGFSADLVQRIEEQGARVYAP